MFKKKGKKPSKPNDLMQPDYVKKAKENLKEEKDEKSKYSKEEIAQIEEFWKKRNPNATFLGDSNGKQ